MSLLRRVLSHPSRSLTSRSQSETIGVVLILGIMFVGALAIVALGATAVNDTEDRLSDERAEKALTQLDSKAGLVALGESDSQFVRFPTDSGEQFSLEQDAGWMNVTFTNQTSNNEQEVMNITMGSVVYEGNNANIAYQGGGVFRSDDQGGQMVSPPEFHFRNGTLTLPAVNVSGDGHLSDSATITQNGVEEKFPIKSAPDKTNPLENHLVTVTVHSEYYEGWGDYFEQRTDGEVDYDHDNKTATLALVSPIELTTVNTAASSLAANGDFTVNGNSATQCGAAPAGDRYTDSYDSSLGKDYCQQIIDGDTNWNGDIVYGGDINIGSGAGGSDFCGEIKGGGDVTMAATGNSDGNQCGQGQGGQPTIYGNISHVGTCNNCNDALAGYAGAPFEVDPINDIETVSQIDWHINSTVARIENETGPANTNPSLSGGDELDAGTYFFDSMTVASGTVEFNTTDGNIEIAVKEDIDIGSGATINVSGDGIVQVYVGGEGVGTGNHLEMSDDASITNANDNGTKFRTYGKRDFNATLGGGGGGNLAKFVGVIYAPPGVDGSGEVVLNGAEIYGALLTGTTRIPSGGTGSIHFDEALLGEQIISPSAAVLKVTYLHVTVNRITID